MNTRFNPTANGRLHLGHLYLVLLNYHMAKRSGGRFVVRFDDDQPHWVDLHGRPAVADYCQLMIEDLEWFGIAADSYSYESVEREANESMVESISTGGKSQISIGMLPEIISCERPYPYVPYLTAVKVAQDFREGIDCLIRGDDLVSEYALYCYFCERLRIRFPRFIYVPKLLHRGADLSDVSKTIGNFKLCDLRSRGMSPESIESLLAQACLLDPHAPWSSENVTRCPTLTAAEVAR